MTEFWHYSEGTQRPPTWAERQRLAQLRESGAEDVFVPPEEAPQEFWNAVIAGTFHFLISGEPYPQWNVWASEVMLSMGLPRPLYPWAAYEDAISSGHWRSLDRDLEPGERLGLIEHLLDSVDPTITDFPGFHGLVNERARWFRVGLRLDEDNRFMATTSEALHVEIVQPTLALLSDPRYEDVNDLYRKGFDRALSGDPSGAVTAATSAVETMLKALLPPATGKKNLGQLADQARTKGLMTPAVAEFTKKLYALREESDAHQAGTDDFAVALLALHLAGSILLYIGETTTPPTNAEGADDAG